MLDARPATRDDIPAMAASLTAAFVDDPVWDRLVPDHARYQRRAPHLFAHEIRTKLAHGLVTTTPSGEAAALWAAPGRWRPSALQRIGELPAALPLFAPRLRTGIRLLDMVEKAHPKAPEHWYLALLGTHPTHQGKGLGSAVLQPVLDRCDADGLPAYLESSKESNIAFYARHGFEQRDPLEFPDGPTFFPMWREPRP